jgi:hypothetical protein
VVMVWGQVMCPVALGARGVRDASRAIIRLKIKQHSSNETSFVPHYRATARGNWLLRAWWFDRAFMIPKRHIT